MNGMEAYLKTNQSFNMNLRFHKMTKVVNVKHTVVSASVAVIVRMDKPTACVSRIVRLYCLGLNTGGKRLRFTLITTTEVSDKRGLPPSWTLTRTCKLNIK
jgi:hypothetical protein